METPTPGTAATELKIPYFLVALPQMQDPLFQKCVILVASHDADGAFGLILNRVLVDEEEGAGAVMKAEIKDQDGNLLYEFSEELFEGGPVHEESVFVLHDKADTAIPTPEIGTEKIFVSSDPQVFQQILGEKGADVSARFFLGCSSWTAGQLDSEIRSGSWVLVPFDKQFLFTKKPALGENSAKNVEDTHRWQEALWRRVLLTSGLDPLTLLAQGDGHGDGSLN